MATIKAAATKARAGENGDVREGDVRESDDWDAADPGGSGGVRDVAGL